jgi:predicted GIY-YIG superfamily endonuclease
MYLVYILQSHNCSYVGMTNNFERRWKQHNGILQGGAKYTKRYNDWTPICIIDGFQTKKEAMQCEWKLKRVRGYYNRVRNVSTLLTTSKQWTKKSPLIQDQELQIYVTRDYTSLFPFLVQEIEWYSTTLY